MFLKLFLSVLILRPKSLTCFWNSPNFLIQVAIDLNIWTFEKCSGASEEFIFDLLSSHHPLFVFFFSCSHPNLPLFPQRETKTINQKKRTPRFSQKNFSTKVRVDISHDPPLLTLGNPDWSLWEQDKNSRDHPPEQVFNKNKQISQRFSRDSYRSWSKSLGSLELPLLWKPFFWCFGGMTNMIRDRRA